MSERVDGHFYSVGYSLTKILRPLCATDDERRAVEDLAEGFGLESQLRLCARMLDDVGENETADSMRAMVVPTKTWVCRCATPCVHRRDCRS